jgi:hypothetical protein
MIFGKQHQAVSKLQVPRTRVKRVKLIDYLKKSPGMIIHHDGLVMYGPLSSSMPYVMACNLAFIILRRIVKNRWIDLKELDSRVL